jgi:hypothetical protein
MPRPCKQHPLRRVSGQKYLFETLLNKIAFLRTHGLYVAKHGITSETPQLILSPLEGYAQYCWGPPPERKGLAVSGEDRGHGHPFLSHTFNCLMRSSKDCPVRLMCSPNSRRKRSVTSWANFSSFAVQSDSGGHFEEVTSVTSCARIASAGRCRRRRRGDFRQQNFRCSFLVPLAFRLENLRD